MTGQGMYGALKGQQLTLVDHDELTFGEWKQEQPLGRVLRPDPMKAGMYESADWEERYAKFPVLTQPEGDGSIKPRLLVFGIAIDGASKAYRSSELHAKEPVIDQVGQVPVLILEGPDGKSVRAFDRSVDGRVLEFFSKPDSKDFTIVDSQTGSQWDFTGKAVSGELAGRQLKQIDVLPDYWFDWKTYHPDTAVY